MTIFTDSELLQYIELLIEDNKREAWIVMEELLEEMINVLRERLE